MPQVVILTHENYTESMDDVKTMFKTLVNGQSAMKSELLTEIRKVDKKVDLVREDLQKVEANLTKRIDKIGLQVANLEDDTPTIDEFDKLETRVKVIERIHKIATV